MCGLGAAEERIYIQVILAWAPPSARRSERGPRRSVDQDQEVGERSRKKRKTRTSVPSLGELLQDLIDLFKLCVRKSHVRSSDICIRPNRRASQLLVPVLRFILNVMRPGRDAADQASKSRRNSLSSTLSFLDDPGIAMMLGLSLSAYAIARCEAGTPRVVASDLRAETSWRLIAEVGIGTGVGLGEKERQRVPRGGTTGKGEGRTEVFLAEAGESCLSTTR